MSPSRRWLNAIGIILVLIALALIALIAFAGNVVINLLTPWLEEQLQPRLGPRYVPILVTFVLAAALIAVVSTVGGFWWNRRRSAPGAQQQPQHAPSTPTPPLTATEREAILSTVETIWVRGKRNESLPSPGLIDLSFVPRPDAVERIRGYEEHQFKVWQTDLDTSPDVSHIFRDAQRELLILGAPGSGKSTTLYTIAERLIAEARSDPDMPMPIIFELSEWSAHRGTLQEWLIDRLRHGTISISEHRAQELLDHEHVSVLLDGLDEIADLAVRKQCVDAINAFIHDRRGRVPLVVSCRIDDFEAMDLRIDVQRAVEVQPLTLSQVQDYLAREGRKLSGLRKAIREQAELLEIATSPLFLWLLTKNYPNTASAEIVSELSQGNVRNKILHAYIGQGGAPTPRRAAALRIPPEELNATVVWLARGMHKHRQQVFHIELLQPTWLATNQQQRGWRIIDGLVSGLLVGLALWLSVWIRFSQIFGLFAGVIFGLLSVLSFAIFVGSKDSVILREQLVLVPARDVFVRKNNHILDANMDNLGALRGIALPVSRAGQYKRSVVVCATHCAMDLSY